MNREVSFDLVERSNNSSGVLDRLKSRYLCAHEPLPPAAATAIPDDRTYLSPLWVFEDQEMDGPESPLPPSFSNLMVDQNIIDPHMIKEKIASVLKVLKFGEQHILVQFWSPVAVRKRWLLTTWDQPFGLGVPDEGLCSYRIKSELCPIVAGGEQRDKISSPGRVYVHKLPEWSLDVSGQDASYNIHGYINLPVFESSSDCCVGVLEIITSSSYVDFAFEVLEVSRALKYQNLKSPSVFEDPSFSVSGVPSNRTLSRSISITGSDLISSAYEALFRDEELYSTFMGKMIKVEYNDDLIKFALPISAEFADLHRNVTTRLTELEHQNFRFEYSDTEGNRFPISGDEDLWVCMAESSSKGAKFIKMFVLLNI